MDSIQGVFGQFSPATLSLLVVTGSLVLVVVVGGLVSLRRYYSKPAQPASEEESGAAKPAPSQKSVEAAVEAYQQRAAGDDIREWEDELNKKLNELENRFAALAHKLGRMGAIDKESSDVVRVLSERGMRREDLLPRVAKLKRQGMQTAAIARQLSLSEEQMKLIQRLAARQQSEHVVGA